MLAACSAHLKVPDVIILIYIGEKYKYNISYNAVSFSLLLFPLCYGKTFSSVTSVVKRLSYKNYNDMEEVSQIVFMASLKVSCFLPILTL
jgi:hypothetical protein